MSVLPGEAYDCLRTIKTVAEQVGSLLIGEAKRLTEIIDQHNKEHAMSAEERRLTPLLNAIREKLVEEGLPATASFYEESGFTGIRVGIDNDINGERWLLIEDSFADYARIGIYAEGTEPDDEEVPLFDLGDGKPMLDSASLPPQFVAGIVASLIRFAKAT